MKKLSFLTIVLSLLSFLSSFATSYTWTGSTSTDWATSSNWSPSGVPSAGTDVTIGSTTRQPLLDGNRTIGSLTISTNTLDLNGYTLSLTTTGIFTSGSINNGVLSMSGQSGTTAKFNGTTFGAAVSVNVASIELSGSTFNSTLAIVKNGATNDQGSGNCTFNAAVELIDSASGSIVLGNSSPDIFNSTLTVKVRDRGNVYLAHNSTGTQFNGAVQVYTSDDGGAYFCYYGTAEFNDNIFVNSSKTGVFFGMDKGISTLATGGRLSLGTSGFTKGTLYLRNFIQAGLEDTTILALTSTAIAKFETGSEWNATVIVAAPKIYLDGSRFKNTSSFTYHDTTGATSLGGNYFYHDAVILNNSSGDALFSLSATDVDTFETSATFINSAGKTEINNAVFLSDANFTNSCLSSTANRIFIASSGSCLFNGNLNLTDTVGGIIFGDKSGTTSFTDGAKLLLNDTYQGNLTLRYVTYNDTLTTSLALGNDDKLTIDSSSLGGPLFFTGRHILLNSSNFTGLVNIDRTLSNSIDASDGGNYFGKDVIISDSSGSGKHLRFANLYPDTYTGDATFTRKGLANLQPAYNADSYFEGSLYLGGNNETSFNDNGGRVIFRGPNRQTLNATANGKPHFKKIELNKDDGSVQLNFPLTLNDTLYLTKGILITDTTNLLVVPDNLAIIGGSDTAFVSGPVKKVGNDAFIFPIGKDKYFHPLDITAPSSATDAFTAEYFGEQQSFGDNIDNSLENLSTCNYWDLNKISGSSSVMVGLSWSTNSCNVYSILKRRVTYWDGTKWKDKGGIISGSLSSGEVVSSTNLSSFGHFALADSLCTSLIAPTSTSNVHCHGGNDGEAEVTVSGGTAPFQIQWFRADSIPWFLCDTCVSISNLIYRDYYVVVTDSNGCTSSTGFSISEPDGITVSVSTSEVDCYYSSTDGVAIVDIEEEGDYTYQWNASPEETSPTATGLSAGIDTVIITDENGCEYIQRYEIAAASRPLLSSIHYLADGGILSVIPDGGIRPYSYSWNIDSVPNDTILTGLGPGTYSVTITDALNCAVTEEYSIPDYSSLGGCEWAHSEGMGSVTSHQDLGLDVDFDSDGNSYFVSELHSGSATKISITKYDASGFSPWNVQVTGTCGFTNPSANIEERSLNVRYKNGMVYTAFISSETSALSCTAVGTGEVSILKLAPLDGACSSLIKTAVGDNNTTNPAGVHFDVDDGDNVYLGGQWFGNTSLGNILNLGSQTLLHTGDPGSVNNEFDAYICKIESDGTVDWAKSIGTNENQPTIDRFADVIRGVSFNNNILTVLGTYTSKLLPLGAPNQARTQYDYANTTPPVILNAGTGKTHSFIFYIDASPTSTGDLAPSAQYEYVTIVATALAGGGESIVKAGQFNGSSYFVTGTSSGASSTTPAYWLQGTISGQITEYNCVWAARFKNNWNSGYPVAKEVVRDVSSGAFFTSYDLCIEPISDDVYITGAFKGTCLFGPSTVHASVTSTETDVFVAHYSSDLSTFNVPAFYGGANDDFGGGIAVHGCQQFITGNFTGSVTFVGSTLSTTPPNADVYHVDIISPPTASITNSGPNTVICAGNDYTLTAQPAGNSYLWNTLETTQSIHVWKPGTYSVTITNCCATTATITLTADPNCCYDAGIDQQHTLYNPTVSSDRTGNYILNGTMTVNSDVNFLSGSLLMGANARINVTNGHTLNLGSFNISSCGDMWDGIYASTGANFILWIQSGSTISDALSAINLSNGDQLTIDEGTFDNNYVSVNFSSGDYSSSYIHDANFTSSALKPPHSGEIAHIFINADASYLLTVGDASNTANTCYFDNADFGIKSMFPLDIYVVNSEFTDLGYGIYAKGAGSSYSLSVGSSDADYGCVFNNCGYGISAQNRVATTVQNCKLNDNEYGISIYKCDFQHLITGNELHRNNFGIVLYDSWYVSNSNYTSIYNNFINVDPTTHDPDTYSSVTYSRKGIEVANSLSRPTNITLLENYISNCINGVIIRNADYLSLESNNVILNIPESQLYTHYGYRIQHSYKLSALSNNVVNSVFSPTSSELNNFYGFSVENCQQDFIKSNYMYGMGKGMRLLSAVNGTQLHCNDFDSDYEGVYLNNVNMSAQGTPTTGWGNTWEQTAASSGPYQIDGTINGLLRWYFYGTLASNNIYCPYYVSPVNLNIVTASQNELSCVIWNPNSADERDDEYGYMVYNTDTFPEDSIENTYYKQLYYHHSVRENPDLLSLDGYTDTLYTAAYTVLDEGNIGSFYRVDSLIAAGEIEDALDAVNDIDPDNTIEENGKTLRQIYLQTIAMDTTLSSADSTVLDSIAHLDPFLNGGAVFEAQAMIGLALDYDDGGGSPRPAFNSARVNPSHSVLYPNPASDYVTVKYNLTDIENGYLEVTDALGSQVAIYKIKGEAKQVTIKTGQLTSGVYYVKTIVNSEIRSVDKLIIVR